MKKTRTIGVVFLALLSAAIAFSVTCTVVTESAAYVAHPHSAEAASVNYIMYGLFLGIPLGIAAAWLVGQKVEKYLIKLREKL